jgi:hypothetical protein
MNSDQRGENWDEMTGRQFRMLSACRYLEGGRPRWAFLWAKDDTQFYAFGGTRDAVTGFIRDKRGERMRPVVLSSCPPVASKDVPGDLFSTVLAPDGGIAWQDYFDLTAERLGRLVEEQRKQGWRLDYVYAYQDGDAVRFLAVFVDNPGKEQWDFRAGLTPDAYEAALAERKRRGLRPLAVTPPTPRGARPATPPSGSATGQGSDESRVTSHEGGASPRPSPPCLWGV